MNNEFFVSKYIRIYNIYFYDSLRKKFVINGFRQFISNLYLKALFIIAELYLIIEND